LAVLAAVAAVSVAIRAEAADQPPPARPHIGHVFVLNLENKGFDETFGASSPAPYLSRTLRAQGQLLTQYYGIAHNSLGNYIAQISGQGPNLGTQADCPWYTNFVKVGQNADGQAIGQGCVYPTSVPTVADQFTAKGLTWKAYQEDMATPCRHPQVGRLDDTQKARVGDQYAVRHNPFMYFHSVIDSPDCAKNDVPLEALSADLKTASATPDLTYITPNLCNDGHDSPCVDGRPGGLAAADAFLQNWVPRILASPAYQHDGLLVIAFDEADGVRDASACCGEGAGPNTPLPGIFGPGGGRTGALVLSPFVAAGSWNNTGYNHYGLLRTIEDTFGLPHLGYAAAPQVRAFGFDVYAAH
jgi:phospholipase C